MKNIYLIFLLFAILTSAHSRDWVKIRDEDNQVLDIESNGAAAVNIQDQHTEIIDLYMHRNLASFTLDSVADTGDVKLYPTSGHGIQAGETLCFKDSFRYTQVVALTVTTDTVWLDTPLDNTYTITGTYHRGEHDLSTYAANLENPIYFHIEPPDSVTWDIVRILFHIEDNATMDDGTFGGEDALTNGIVLRVVNGDYKNIFNVKTNGEFAERAYDREYVSKPPTGTGNAVNIRRTFGGQSKNGVVIRLDGSASQQLQIILQDTLTGLSHLHAIVQGHRVTY